MNAAERTVDELTALTARTRRYLRKVQAYAVVPDKPVVEVSYPCIVLNADDGHYPFTDDATLRLAWARAQELSKLTGIRAIYHVEHEGADYAGMSFFSQDYSADTLWEEEQYCEQLRWKLARYNRVILGKSNHMDRPTKHFIRDEATADQRAYQQATHEGPLDKLAAEHQGLVRVNSPVVQIGDAVYCHFDDYLGMPGATVRRVWEHIGSNGYWRGVREPVRLIRAGHTHGIWEGELIGTTVVACEVGCGTWIQPYNAKATKIKGYGRKPWFNAFVLDAFDKRGRAILDRCQLVKVGLARLPKWARK